MAYTNTISIPGTGIPYVPPPSVGGVDFLRGLEVPYGEDNEYHISYFMKIPAQLKASKHSQGFGLGSSLFTSDVVTV